MKNIRTKLAAVALSLCAAVTPALAGKGGSAGLVSAAISSGSTDAIIAEVERTEGLMCEDCVQMITNLTEDSRYPVREVAAWWFAKRPALQEMLATQFVAELANGDTVHTRNAADFLGTTKTYTSLPALRAAINRDLGSDAKLAIVRAVGRLSHVGGNVVLTTAMTDRDAAVRALAVVTWRDILDQKNAAPVVSLLADPDARVRAEAATVVGAMKEMSARLTLETMVVADTDATVRRNAAYALGKMGQAASRAALATAAADKSSLVRATAAAALNQLH